MAPSLLRYAVEQASNRRMGTRNGVNGSDWRGVIGVAMGAISLISGVVWWALTSQLTQLQHALELNKGELQHYIDQVKSESTSTYTRIEEVKRLDQEIVEVKRRLDGIRDEEIRQDKKVTSLYMTKDGYVGQHSLLVDQVARLGDRVNEVRTDLSRISPPGDTLKELQERIKSLESRIYQQKKGDTP